MVAFASQTAKLVCGEIGNLLGFDQLPFFHEGPELLPLRVSFRYQLMLRASLFTIFSLVASIGLAENLNWQQVFPVRSHNFGTVAVAAKTEFKFPVHNTTSRPIHIREVRASCGCTTPIVESNYIAPNQTSFIRARFNTGTFKGKKGANLTVVIDQPYYTEVRLRVDGYIRSDMVFHPGALDFGKLSQGDAAEKATKIFYAGRNDWAILNVTSNQPWLIPSFKETNRGGGRVNYELTVDVREDAPTGFFQDELLILTNDRAMPRVPLRVSGDVSSELSISPQAIALGSLKPGQPVEEKMILLGKKPFVIESIVAKGWDIDVDLSPEPKKTHILRPKFTAQGEQLGPQKSIIVITTAGEDSVTAKALLTADVRDQ